MDLPQNLGNVVFEIPLRIVALETRGIAYPPDVISAAIALDVLRRQRPAGDLVT